MRRRVTAPIRIIQARETGHDRGNAIRHRYAGENDFGVQGFRELIRTKGPDETVKLEVQRGSRLVGIEMKLGQQPKLKTSK